MTQVQSAMYAALTGRARALWPYRQKRRSEITTLVREARRLRYGYAVARYRPRNTKLSTAA